MPCPYRVFDLFLGGLSIIKIGWRGTAIENLFLDGNVD